MKTFQQEIILNYPIQIIFQFFTESAKNSFPSFDEKNPIGTSFTQKNNKRLKAEITAYEKNKLYEIKLANKREYCITRYELYPIHSSSTKLIFTESESERNFFGKINSGFVYLLFGKKQPEELNQFIKMMCNTLDTKK